jgi:hypothetical protein
MVAVYFVLPFRVQLGDVLHSVSHEIESVFSGWFVGSASHLHHSHGHLHHDHSHHGELEGHAEDHSHALLAFIDEWLQDAEPEPDSENEFLKFAFDKHYSTQASADLNRLYYTEDDLRFFLNACLLDGFEIKPYLPPEKTLMG